jgi:hypothetical protein
MAKTLAVLLAGALSLWPADAAAAGGGWQHYVNPRFGAAADVPARGFTADPPPANGDGQSWTSTADGGTVAVYGANQVVADDFPGYRRFVLKSAREDGLRITYDRHGEGWFVYSGRSGATIVYERVEEACDGVVVAIHFRYPAAAQAVWKAYVEHGAASLEAVPSDACP